MEAHDDPISLHLNVRVKSCSNSSKSAHSSCSSPPRVEQKRNNSPLKELLHLPRLSRFLLLASAWPSKELKDCFYLPGFHLSFFFIISPFGTDVLHERLQTSTTPQESISWHWKGKPKWKNPTHGTLEWQSKLPALKTIPLPQNHLLSAKPNLGGSTSSDPLRLDRDEIASARPERLRHLLLRENERKILASS